MNLERLWLRRRSFRRLRIQNRSMSKPNTMMAVAAPPIAMPTIWGVVSPLPEVAFSEIALAPAVPLGSADILVLDETSVGAGIASDAKVADEVAIIHVGLSVAITMVLTSAVKVGLPIVAGNVFMVESIDVELPSMVAVIVRAVLDCALAIPSQILYTLTSSSSCPVQKDTTHCTDPSPIVSPARLGCSHR